MSEKTILRFIGSLAERFPEMTSNSIGMASGNVLSWINGCLKIVDTTGNIIILCSEKKNTKLMEAEISKMYDNIKTWEDEALYQAEQKLISSKLKAIQKMKADFEKQKEELSNRVLNTKLSEYENAVKEQELISHKMQNLRNDLKTMIDELFTLHDAESFTLLSIKEQNQYDECLRLLQRQYNKSFDI